MTSPTPTPPSALRAADELDGLRARNKRLAVANDKHRARAVTAETELRALRRDRDAYRVVVDAARDVRNLFTALNMPDPDDISDYDATLGRLCSAVDSLDSEERQ